jgi:hypothetical protein
MSDLYDHRRKRTMDELALACASICGVQPRRSPRELLTLVQAAGLAPEDIAASFWRNVRRDWLRGEQDDEPFEIAAANAEYRFLAELRGLLGHCLACGRPARALSPFCDRECGALWARAKRGYFSGPPLNMPAAAVEALLAVIVGEEASAPGARSLRRYLDGAA